MPEEGGGNPEADIMMICRECEKTRYKDGNYHGPDGGGTTDRYHT